MIRKTLESGKEIHDLRVHKTLLAIDAAFSELLLEYDYEYISIKNLCLKAKINKKTFYRYYSSLYDLLLKKIKDISNEYIKRISKYKLPDDFKCINREFFIYSNEQGKLYEKIVCHPSYSSFGEKMLNDMVHMAWKNSQFFSSLDFYKQNLLLCFLFNTGLSIYKQWIADGKVVDIEEIISLSEALLCNGINGFIQIS